MMGNGPEVASLWPLSADQIPVEGAPDTTARAFWIRASDGIRLRVALWLAGDRPPRGTVFFFPGRTEFIEKYTRIAQIIAGWGLAVLVIDWRGQGASDRLIGDGARHAIGHVNDFKDYQQDVQAMQDLARQLGLPQPWHMVGHSMGGAIGLRALAEGLPVETVSLTSPMWGIAVGPLPDWLSHPLALLLARLACFAGLSENALPGGKGGAADPMGKDAAHEDEAFARNPLTSDRAEWDRMQALYAALPQLVIARPSFGWTRAAFAEGMALARLPAPKQKALITCSEADTIVSASAIKRHTKNWPTAELLSLPRARHEPFFESPATRDPLLAAIKTRIFTL